MYQTDDSRFPLIVITIKGHITSKEAQTILKQWDQWLSHQEPMVILNLNLNDLSDRAQHEDPEAAKYHIQWLKANKPRLRQFLKGMAQVMHSTQAYEMFQSKFSELVERNYGCPGKMFLHQSEAEAWLAQKLTVSTSTEKI